MTKEEKRQRYILQRKTRKDKEFGKLKEKLEELSKNEYPYCKFINLLQELENNNLKGNIRWAMSFIVTDKFAEIIKTKPYKYVSEICGKTYGRSSPYGIKRMYNDANARANNLLYPDTCDKKADQEKNLDNRLPLVFPAAVAK